MPNRMRARVEMGDGRIVFMCPVCRMYCVDERDDCECDLRERRLAERAHNREAVRYRWECSRCGLTGTDVPERCPRCTHLFGFSHGAAVPEGTYSNRPPRNEGLTMERLRESIQRLEYEAELARNRRDHDAATREGFALAVEITAGMRVRSRVPCVICQGGIEIIVPANTTFIAPNLVAHVTCYRAAQASAPAPPHEEPGMRKIIL